MKNTKNTKRIFLNFLLLILILIVPPFTVNASKLKIEHEGVNIVVYLANCSKPGLGSYYLVFAYEPRDAQILNVTPKFLADYNVVNSTILIAGVQGEIPGPTGDVTLVEITSDRELKLNPVVISIKDVYGETIYSFGIESSSLSTTPASDKTTRPPAKLPSSPETTSQLNQLPASRAPWSTPTNNSKQFSIPLESTKEERKGSFRQSSGMEPANESISTTTPKKQTFNGSLRTPSKIPTAQPSQKEISAKMIKKIPVGVNPLLITAALFIGALCYRKKFNS